MIKQAVILAAGKGTRMLDLTKDQAKPMIKVVGRSLIYRIMDQLVEYGICKIVINTFYQADKLERYIRAYDKSKDVEIKLVRETELLETGGGIINMLPYLDKKPFFVVNGDALWVGDNVFSYLNSNWSSNMVALFLLFQKNHVIGYRHDGDFNLGTQNQIIADTSISNKEYVFAGAHIASYNNFIHLEVKKIRLMDVYSKSLGYKNMYGAVFDKASFLHVGDKDAVKESELFFLGS